MLVVVYNANRSSRPGFVKGNRPIVAAKATAKKRS
jgi:hypothetical protein